MPDWILNLVESPQQRVLLATALLGLVFGGLAQWSRFCLLRALVNSYQGKGLAGLRLYLLALAVAVAATQLLVISPSIDLGASLYVQADAPLPLLLFGGVLFGYGMTLANACGARSLVLLGSGNLRSLVTLLALALGAGMVSSGVLAPLRMGLEEASRVSLPWLQLPSWLGGLMALALLFWTLSSAQLRSSPQFWAAGMGIGLCIPAGWWITGFLGADDFEPVRLASLTFVAPVAEAQQYLHLATGTRLSFGIILVAAVIAGAALRALASGEFSWQFFETPSQLRGSLLGGWMMGVGGVLALGCTLGQGLTGISTLALPSFVAFIGILLGCWLRLRWPGAAKTSGARV